MSTPARPSALPRPGRQSLGPSSSGLPTPSRRKSTTPGTPLGASSLGKPSTPDNSEMTLALQEAMRARPPSSLSNVTTASSGPSAGLGLGRPSAAASGQGRSVTGYSTPPSLSTENLAASQRAAAAPRTPMANSVRARTPSGIRPSMSLRQSLATPPASRSVSSYTPRRQSTAGGGNPQTPTHARSESRQSIASARSAAFNPTVGSAVKLVGMGMEGTVRYLGPVEGKTSEFAGVELDPGFAGKGKNSGSHDGKHYFDCEPLCGVFVPLSKLAPPTARPARPSSVASSVRSGRMTPSISGRETPYSISGRRTPALIEEEGNDSPLTGYTHAGRPNEVLGRSTRANVVGQQLQAAAASKSAADKITAGSRASQLMGMTAKQLQSRQAAEAALNSTKGFADGGSVPSASTTSNLSRSTLATTTPRPSRVSLGGASAAARTPSRLTSTAGLTAKYGRESLGGFATPKAPTLAARSGRTSAAGGRTAQEMMPPPPSPSKRIPSGSGAKSDELVQSERRCAELLIRVKELEEQQALSEPPKATLEMPEVDTAQVEKDRKEAEQRIRELTLASEFASKDASGWRVKVEQLNETLEAVSAREKASIASLELLQKEKLAVDAALSKAKQDLAIQKERADTEYEKGMEIKRKEVKAAEDRLHKQEQQIEHERTRYKDLEQTTSEMVQLFEAQEQDFRRKVYTQAEQIRKLEDEIAELQQAKQAAAEKPVEGEAERIDRENAEAQIVHLQGRINSLEDQLHDMEAYGQRADEVAKKLSDKAKESDKRLKEEITLGREEVADVRQQYTKAKQRTVELEGALKENAAALESARAEVETLRADLADLENMRAAHETHTQTTRELEEQVKRVQILEKELADLRQSATQRETAAVADIQERYDRLQAELVEVKDARAKLAAKESSPVTRRGSKMSDADTATIGYQHLIRELESENAAQKQKLQEAENENKELLDELEAIRKEMRVLEDDLDAKLAREEAELEKEEQAGQPGIPDKRLALELERAKVRLVEMERERSELEKETRRKLEEQSREMSELEALVEFKIYREDELEREIEKLQAASRLQNASHSTITAPRPALNNGQSHDVHVRPPSTTSERSDALSSDSQRRCELCEGEHTLESCALFNPTADVLDGLDHADSPLANRMSVMSRSSASGKCQDCGKYGHDMEDCPERDEIF